MIYWAHFFITIAYKFSYTNNFWGATKQYLFLSIHAYINVSLYSSVKISCRISTFEVKTVQLELWWLSFKKNKYFIDKHYTTHAGSSKNKYQTMTTTKFNFLCSSHLSIGRGIEYRKMLSSGSCLWYIIIYMNMSDKC